MTKKTNKELLSEILEKVNKPDYAPAIVELQRDVKNIGRSLDETRSKASAAHDTCIKHEEEIVLINKQIKELRTATAKWSSIAAGAVFSLLELLKYIISHYGG
jgi:hypothetical protein